MGFHYETLFVVIPLRRVIINLNNIELLRMEVMYLITIKFKFLQSDLVIGY